MKSITEILQETLKLEEVKKPRSIYHIDKRELIDWLGDHDQAFEDICNFFHIDSDDEYCEEELAHYQLSDLLDWISDHEQLYDDMLGHFGLGPVVESLTEARGRKPTVKLTYDEVEEAEKVLRDAGFEDFSIDGYGVDPSYSTDSKDVANVLNNAGFACRLETKKEQEDAGRPNKFVFFKTRKRDVEESVKRK